jgi:hypothetical protein
VSVHYQQLPDDGSPPHIRLIQAGLGYRVSQVIFAAADLGLADLIEGNPKSAEDLAGPLKAHAPSLHRLMRTLAGLGVLTELDADRFALTPLGQSLKSDAPGHARATILALGGSAFRRGFDELVYSVRTGKPGFHKAHGMGPFDYLEHSPEHAALFSEAMIGSNAPEQEAVASSYDFSAFRTIVDVGGGSGNLLVQILRRFPETRGVLFDLAHVLTRSAAVLEAGGVANRVERQPGSFFESAPVGGDAYLLSHILHDWNEAQCLTILGNIRKVMSADARLLIIEMVLPAGDAPHPGKMLDMAMMVLHGGQERTGAEYAALLSKADLQLVGVTPTASPVSVIEAVPA